MKISHPLGPLALAGLVAGALFTTDALAQAEAPASPPPTGLPQAPPEKIEPPPQTPSQDPASSEALQQNKSVITPPAGVDPAMTKPPPDNGTAVMPVIPPPENPAPK